MLQPFFKDCPLCSSAKRVPFVTHAQLEFAKCLDCELVYKSQTAAAPDETALYSQSYFEQGKQQYAKKFKHRVKKAGAEIRLCADAGFYMRGVVGDLGCSYGYVLEAARRIGLTAVGMDLSEHAVKICRERGYAAKTGSLETLPFDAASLDLILAKHVLEHTRNPKRAAEEMFRALKPGGFCFVAVPDLDYWKARFFRQSYHYFLPHRAGREHHVYFTAKTLQKLLERAGFRPLKLVSRLPLKGLWAFLHLRHEICLVGKKPV